MFSKFNVYKISPALQSIYDDMKMPQPINKQMCLKQSLSHANLIRHNSSKEDQDLNLPPALQIDTRNAPRFYLKFASYLLDQE